jgi:hypothetical protein
VQTFPGDFRVFEFEQRVGFVAEEFFDVFHGF